MFYNGHNIDTNRRRGKEYAAFARNYVDLVPEVYDPDETSLDQDRRAVHGVRLFSRGGPDFFQTPPPA